MNDTLNPITKKQLASFFAAPSHALLLVGKKGSGKKDLAIEVAIKLTGKAGPILRNSGRLIEVEPAGKGEIPIEAIRNLKRQLILKVSGRGHRYRVVLIEQADTMTLEAQNAVLKLLEEPPLQTIFVLTAANKSKLQPTVISRCQQIIIRPVSLKTAKAVYSEFKSSELVDQAFYLSGGRARLLSEILADDGRQYYQASIGKAKQFLRSDSYERYKIMAEMAADKAVLVDFIENLDKVLAALQDRDYRMSKANAARLIAARKQLLDYQQAVKDNANPKLLTLEVGLQLRP